MPAKNLKSAYLVDKKALTPLKSVTFIIINTKSPFILGYFVPLGKFSLSTTKSLC